MNFKRVDYVSKWRLCMGCGACAAVCPEHNIQLVDVFAEGLRPVIDSDKCRMCGTCIGVCPGIEISHKPFNNSTFPQLQQAWGPVLEMNEGYAADHEIRFMGSSGGAATALALFCLEKSNFSGVLHIGTNPKAPLQNIPVFSNNREELIRCTGSRYSPAAPCEKLSWAEEVDSPCVFIGKPCDVVAIRKAMAINQKLENKIGLIISIFCAGTPSSMGTYKLLDSLSVKTDEVKEIRYRGLGWPGMTTVKLQNNSETRQMSYEESWGNILSKYCQFRCRLCPDSTGEFADISCGDPWYRQVESGESGRSLVLVRTKRGRDILKQAIKAGYLTLEPVNFDVLPNSQKSLLRRRRHLWGRLLAMRIMCIPVPIFEGFSLYSNWKNLPWSEKIRSIGGTFKRIVQRNLCRPVRMPKGENRLS